MTVASDVVMVLRLTQTSNLMVTNKNFNSEVIMRLLTIFMLFLIIFMLFLISSCADPASVFDSDMFNSDMFNSDICKSEVVYRGDYESGVSEWEFGNTINSGLKVLDVYVISETRVIYVENRSAIFDYENHMLRVGVLSKCNYFVIVKD